MTFATATLYFEVRTTGSDNNGGGFDSGVASPGTDYSQQDSAQIAYTDLVIGTTGNENQLTSAANPFGSTVPGNVINITGGTGFSHGLYRIVSVSGSTATMDRDVGIANSTGGTGNLGGAFATPNKATSNMTVGGQITYIKGGTYQMGSFEGPDLTNDNGFYRLIGYSSTRGDNGQATIQASVATTDLATLGGSSAGLSCENLIFDGNNTSGANGFYFPPTAHVLITFVNCIFKNFTGNFCIRNLGNSILNLQACEFSGNAFTTDKSACILGRTDSGVGSPGGSIMVTIVNCYFSGNSISSTNLATAIWCEGMALSVEHSIFYNNTGTNMDGIVIRNAQTVNICNNAIHSNSRHGINIDSGVSTAAACVIPNIQNNIFTSNGGYGINAAYSTTPTIVIVNHNAYYNNASGAKNGFTAGTGEVTLTGLPYVNAPTDFSLNSTAGQGLACQGAATPGSIGVSSVVGTSSAFDIGPLQHSGGVSSAYTFVT
jgi:hypothetical protein